MKQAEYERLKSDALTEYKRKIDAIETVWKMTGGVTLNAATVEGPGISKGALQQAILVALQALPGEFTLRDIEKQIQINDSVFAAKIKRPSISSALKRLADDKKIALVTLGKGKRASTYRRVGGA